MTTQNIFKFLSILCGGLMAGLMFAYSTSVNIGLKSLSDYEYIKAMQSINIAIQNPYFITIFLSPVFLLSVASFLQFKKVASLSFYLLLTATIIYIVGVFGVTMFFNVPLNEQIANSDLSQATSDEISEMRQSFEKPWNYFHQIRTFASIISLSFSLLSIIKSKL